MRASLLLGLVFLILAGVLLASESQRSLADAATSVSAGYYDTCAVTASGGVKCWGDNQYGQLGISTTTDQVKAVSVSGLTSGVTQVSLGHFHSCAIVGSEGRVKCWGYNNNGQLGDGTGGAGTDRFDPVDVCDGGSGSGCTGGAPLIGVSAIAAGSSHTCAAMTDGRVKCWGNNSSGQLGDGTAADASNPVYVCASGFGAGCSGGSFLTAVSNVVAGDIHTCALTMSGGLKCWGDNTYGQLGNGESGNMKTISVDVTGLGSGVTDAAGGNRHTCAVVSGGAKCWGSSDQGQVGDGSHALRATPVDVTGLGSGVASLAAGLFHSCAVTSAGGIKCWGRNLSGQLGDGTGNERATPVDVCLAGTGPGCLGGAALTGVASAEGGHGHTCARNTVGGLVCWGVSADGARGDGEQTSALTPVGVIGLASGVSSVALGDLHTCVRTTTGGARCWGENLQYGQIGDGTTEHRITPARVCASGAGPSCTPLTGVAGITTGDYHSCALLADTGALCWGLNDKGRLGDGTTTDRINPTVVCASGSGPGCAGGSALTGVAAIAAGDYHTCARISPGDGVKCWGTNGDGQLGDGTTSNRFNPIEVCASGSGTACTGGSPLTGVAMVSPGQAHTCALVGGQVKCWGLNVDGRLGDGTTSNSLNPVDVCASGSGLSCVVLTGVTAVAAGEGHTCAVMAAGGVKCWGQNGNGQLGDGTTSDRLNPADVCASGSGPSCTPLTGVTAASGGQYHTCALTSAGGVKCWGNNLLGQLGDGTTTGRLNPVNVCRSGSGPSCVALDGVAMVATNRSHTCAVTTTAGLKCWGFNLWGQVGGGSTMSITKPAIVVDFCLSVGMQWVVPAGDEDCDGWTAGLETAIGTDTIDPCADTVDPDDEYGPVVFDAPMSPWPPDFNDDRVVNISDVLALKPVFGTPVPPTPARYDIVPSGGINISDVLSVKPFFGKICTP